MRSVVRLIGFLGLVVIVALTPTWGPRLLSGIDLFGARNVDVVGATFVSEADIRALGRIDVSTSIWTPLEEMEARLVEHPLIESVAVERGLPDRLVVRIEERKPVALVPTPTLRPVDRNGDYLPLDPAEWQLDLPLIEPLVEPGDDAHYPRPARLRELARLAWEMQGDAVFWTRVSVIREVERGEFVAEWATPEVAFKLAGGTPLRRLQQGVVALSAELQSGEDALPRAVDLRWDGVVYVCSRRGRSRSECEDI